MRTKGRRRKMAAVGWVTCLVVAASVVAATWDAPGFGQASLDRYVMRADAVRDIQTRLVWQRAVPPGGLSFAAAGRYCSDLSLDSADDWRVPSMQELQTLVDEGRAKPAIDPTAFPDTPGEGFWSGTSWGGTTALAWHTDFDFGGAAYDTATMEYRVRCVRWDGP